MKKLILALLVCGSANASEPWTHAQVAAQVAVETTLFLDYKQTGINPGYYETNPLLGKYPSNARVTNYFLAVGVAHLVLVDALPSKYRAYAQYPALLVELVQIVKNKRVGIHFNF